MIFVLFCYLSIEQWISSRLVPDIKMSLLTKFKFLSYLLQLVYSTLDTCTEEEEEEEEMIYLKMKQGKNRHMLNIEMKEY